MIGEKAAMIVAEQLGICGEESLHGEKRVSNL
jgi:hypothetical protein